MFDKYKKPRVQRLVPERRPLAALHRQIMEISNPTAMALRRVRWCEAREEYLRNLALESGAMPGDFRIDLVFRRFQGIVPELR